MEASATVSLVIDIQRGRSALRVTARTPEREPELVVEAIFSGGPEGMWLRLTRAAQPRVFSRHEVARHPALSALLRLIADEADAAGPASARPQADALLASLFRSLLIYVGRLSTLVPLPRWGRPLRDRRIERAIELLNQDIARRWTVALLARAVGVSRPVFARQFQRVLGLSPMRYLTQRRMQVAAALLLDSGASLAEVAGHVGYASEFAFNRAFKRHHHVPPGVYRQRRPAALQVPHALAA